MTRYVILLSVILCSTFSFGSGIVYRVGNNSLYELFANQSCTIICSDVNEVEWILRTTGKATNSIDEENPYRKMFKIEKATNYDTGVYRCRSKREPSLFIRFAISIFGEDMPGWKTPESWRKTLALKIQLNKLYE